jgi:hypothetical protein
MAWISFLYLVCVCVCVCVCVYVCVCVRACEDRYDCVNMPGAQRAAGSAKQWDSALEDTNVAVGKEWMGESAYSARSLILSRRSLCLSSDAAFTCRSTRRL